MFSKLFGTQPHAGEELNCVREITNTEDPHAVAVICRNAVVGQRGNEATMTKQSHLVVSFPDPTLVLEPDP